MPTLEELVKDVDLEKGLSEEEVRRRMEEYGANILPEETLPNDLEIFISQLKNPLIYVLLVAGIVTFILKEYTDTVIIFLAVFVNTILGFVQERKAGRALEALKKLIHPTVRVVRSGEVVILGTEELVPGDVVVLNQGDKVSADGILVETNRFFVSEAILTGESIPIEKGDKDDAYMGTVVTAGNAKLIVTVIGADTEMGKIASSVSGIDEDTPLRRQLAKFSNQLSVLVLLLLVAIFAIGLVLGKDPLEIFKISVALAVSAIPEGLLVGLTAVLAIGMQRILSKKGLVRNLVSAETLGGVTVICVDKTGTLTQGKMQVVEVVGDRNELAAQVCIANDLDDPIVIAAYEWGKEVMGGGAELSTKYSRLDSIPFSSDERVFSSLNMWDDSSNVIFVNGAPEVLLERSLLSKEDRGDLQRRIEKLSSEGKRVLGFAQKRVSHLVGELSLEDTKEGLEWVGLLAFSDPVREDVREAFEGTRSAGIDLIVITGDYARTAQAVMKQINIEVKDSDVILGEEVESLSNKELEDRIYGSKSVKIFARTKPYQKLKIVDVLKGRGEVVAMMGDGVNDAPALKKADIGIVVGDASDVAKETADLVLLNSSFATIVYAIEEGRGIFDNIRKIVLYLMCDAFVEVFVVIVALVIGLPLPITAAQILWVNLISDGFPSLALTIDPKAPGIMRRLPRSPKEHLVNKWMYKLITMVSFVGGILATFMFIYTYKTSGDINFARSVTFATVGINSLVYVFSIRTLEQPFWKENLFENKWLILAVIGGLVLQFSPFLFTPLRSFLGLVPLGMIWAYVVLVSVLMFLGVEISKHLFRERLS